MNIDPSISKTSRVKACDYCRQNKLRCDASKDTSEPCSRCRRRGLTCVISATFVRTKRRTKSELQAEIDALRQQVHSSPQDGAVLSPKTSQQAHSAVTGPSPSIPSPLRLQHRGSIAASTTSPLQQEVYHPPPSPLKTPLRTHGTSTPEPTRERTIDGFRISTAAIEDCFEIFSQHYLPQLPLLDPPIRPNHCYQQSTLLFWAIVAVGARKYVADPTLLAQLMPPLTALAKIHALSRESPIQTIQALLLLSMWPMPFDSLSKDISPMLTGVIIQHALTIGLHIFGMGQDFSRVKLAWDRAQIAFRARLWALTISTCQRLNATDGISPPSVPDNYDHEYCRVQASNALTPSIKFQKALNQILTEAILELQRSALSRAPAQRATAINPIVDAVILQLNELASTVTCEIDRFYLLCGELQIENFHLFTPSASIDPRKLILTYELSCDAIAVALELDRIHNFAEHAPMPVSKYLQLASYTILKITRSSVASQVDLAKGQRLYFAVIQFHRKMSVQHGDVSSRSTSIMTQLWTSREIFKKSDGSFDSLSLRCGSRLAMSVMFDSFWWWRQEFAGVPNPYEDRPDENNDGSRPTTSRLPSMRDLAMQVSDSTGGAVMAGGGGADNMLFADDFWSWQETFPEFGFPSQYDLVNIPNNNYFDGPLEPSFSIMPPPELGTHWG